MKEIKIHAVEKREAIDFSPIYMIIIDSNIKLQRGDVLTFDPACKSLTVGFNTNNA